MDAREIARASPVAYSKVTTVVLCVANAMCFSFAFCSDSFRYLASSDDALLSLVRASAYEDIFAFGFWVTSALFATLEICLLAIAWLVSGDVRSRSAVVVACLAFLVAWVLYYFANSRLEYFWQNTST